MVMGGEYILSRYTGILIESHYYKMFHSFLYVKIHNYFKILNAQ